MPMPIGPLTLDANRPTDDQESIRDVINRVDQLDGVGQNLLRVVSEKPVSYNLRI